MKNGRGGEIRTHDLLHPKQARIPGYATPRPKFRSRNERERNSRNPTVEFNIFPILFRSFQQFGAHLFILVAAECACPGRGNVGAPASMGDLGDLPPSNLSADEDVRAPFPGFGLGQPR